MDAEGATAGDFDRLREVTSLFAGFSQPWMVAGGWAIDLFLGRATRHHKDVDVAVFRPDQLAVQRYLHGWQLYVAHGGRLDPWQEGAYLKPPAHGIWAWPSSAVAGNVDDPPELEVLLDEMSATHWLYRRNPKVTRELEQVCMWGGPRGSIPYFAPEIVLLYKSREARETDTHDFEAVWPELDSEQRAWLMQALQVCTPEHAWLR